MAFEMLELDEGKLSRPVLRRGGESNLASLSRLATSCRNEKLSDVGNLSSGRQVIPPNTGNIAEGMRGAGGSRRYCCRTIHAPRGRRCLSSTVREDSTTSRRVAGARVPTGFHRSASALEDVVKRFATSLLRWRWGVLLLLVGITSGALCGVARLRVDPSSDRLLPRQ